MGKERIDIEYPLTTKSFSLVWEQISSAHGLERWIANRVSDEDGVFTFTWGELWTQQDIRSAQLLEYVKNDHIRLKWEEDEDEDAYWEMSITRSDLTGYLTLHIVDFAWPEEKEDLKALWDGNLERLHRASGL